MFKNIISNFRRLTTKERIIYGLSAFVILNTLIPLFVLTFTAVSIWWLNGSALSVFIHLMVRFILLIVIISYFLFKIERSPLKWF